MAKKTAGAWRGKVGHWRQLGGIETGVVDNGAAAGSRFAWVNTGSGLVFKVAIDNGMDIAEAYYNGKSLCWVSPGGFSCPRPDANRGLEWLYSFGGGLVRTCGLTHVGGPEVEDGCERGLHGRIANCRAEVESVIEPDVFSGKGDMSITGVMRQSAIFFESFELKRTISAVLGEPAIMIRDTVTNRAPKAMGLMLLYHCNFGWPLVDEGSDIVYKGEVLNKEGEIFGGKRYKKCRAPMESHIGGEAVGFIDVKADSKGRCEAGIANSKLGLAVKMEYSKRQLGAFSNWQRFAPGQYVVGMEPGTNNPIGQKAAREGGKLTMLKSGASRKFELKLSVIDGKSEVEKWVKKNNG
jgi:hypothetical protein